VYQVSAWSKHAFTFYSNFSKCAKRQRMRSRKKQRNLNETLGACISKTAGAISFKYSIGLPTWQISLQQIWLNSGMRSWSYIGVKIMFSFFLSIYSQCSAPTSWATRHNTVCLDTNLLSRLQGKLILAMTWKSVRR